MYIRSLRDSFRLFRSRFASFESVYVLLEIFMHLYGQKCHFRDVKDFCGTRDYFSVTLNGPLMEGATKSRDRNDCLL